MIIRIEVQISLVSFNFIPNILNFSTANPEVPFYTVSICISNTKKRFNDYDWVLHWERENQVGY